MKENKISERKKILSGYRQLWPYIKPYRYRAFAALLFTLPLGSMDAVLAWILKPYMDQVMVEKQLQASSFFPLVIILISLLQSIFNYSATYLNSWVSNKITSDLKATLFSKMLRYESSFFDKTTSGEIQFRFNNDANLACSGLMINVKTFITRIIASISLIIVLIFNSWQLSIIAVSALFITLYPLTKIRKIIKAIMNKTILSSSKILTHYNEAFAGNRVISSFNLFEYIENKFHITLREIFNNEMKMMKRTGMLSPIMHSIISVGIAGVIWYGGYLVINKELTVGGFISFITALLMLYQPVKSLGSTYTQVQQSLFAIERVLELVNKEPQITNSGKNLYLSKISKSISFNNVYFSYDGNKTILEDISFEIPVGKTVALIGQSGGGKSTIVNLLPRFYDISSGSILIDDIDIRDINLTNLRDNISIVFQDNFLFSGTIRENILFGCQDLDDKTLTKILKQSCLDEFVNSLEKNIDTEIGERGVMLSGGQRQRLAIARSMVKNAPIVILDEATSALDNQSESLVQKALKNLSKNRTVFIIAHRLTTIKNADIILVVQNGKIAERGTHDSLIKNKKSIYSKLYNFL